MIPHRPVPARPTRQDLASLPRLALVLVATLLAASVQRSEQRETWSRLYAKLPNIPVLRPAQVDADTFRTGEATLEALFLAANASFTVSWWHTKASGCPGATCARAGETNKLVFDHRELLVLSLSYWAPLLELLLSCSEVGLPGIGKERS